MFASIIAGLALRSGLSQRVVRIGVIALAAALLTGAAILAWNLWLADHDEGVIAADRAKATVEVLKRNEAAREASAVERAADTQAVSTQEKELKDAIRSVPDAAPDPVRQRLFCDRLRRSGTDTSRLPQCGRPGG